ncbi:hypothetical protein BT96DRAFT_1010789 [Gymnopus androsaceus JB14]|uniref:Uncharacterized protein n=1 Tax=Gymnopus androsaceus JB14 TaxID=1447944 RepID=A0A6A4GA76_9AGAR|nr:hypothetical protein BT96DRAFT_1010789 [Gymnopus androsaceus JB14]
MNMISSAVPIYYKDPTTFTPQLTAWCPSHSFHTHFTPTASDMTTTSSTHSQALVVSQFSGLRKRHANTPNEQNEHEPQSQSQSEWITDKVRAIAGPNQDALDKERAHRKMLEQRLAQIEQEKNDVNDQLHKTLQALQDELESKEVDTELESKEDNDREGLINYLKRAEELAQQDVVKYQAQVTELQETLGKTTRDLEARLHAMVERANRQDDELRDLRNARDEALRDLVCDPNCVCNNSSNNCPGSARVHKHAPSQEYRTS